MPRFLSPVSALAFFLCLILPGTVPAVSPEKGVSAFDSGDYRTAMEAFSGDSARKNPGVQTRLGLMYLNGKGVGKNAATAALWFEKAARQGNAQARFELGRLYLNGTGVTRDEATGLDWLERAAAAGYPPAMNELGAYESRNGRPADALRRYRRSAAANDPEGCYRLSRQLLAEEKNRPGAAREILELTEKAARQHHAEAEFALAEHYRYGDLTEPDAGKALFWYGRSAAQQYLPALTELADIHENGLMDQPADKALAAQLRLRIGQIAGTPAPAPKMKFTDTVETVWDTVKPFSLLLLFLFFPLLRARAKYRTKQIASGMRLFENGQYDMAARFLSKPYIRNYPDAEAMLGEMLALGLGVEKDVAEAMPHLTRPSGENGRAAYLVGTLFENGDGVPVNDTEAVYWYARGARLEDPDAMNRLGVACALGKGVPQNDTKAVGWLEKSLEQGNADAIISLATLVHLGRGTEKDDAKALELTARQAADNHPAALYNLAVATRYGYGTPENAEKALGLYRQSASLKYRPAMLALADWLDKGTPDIPPDPSEANDWRDKARQLPPDTPSRSCLLYPE